VVTKLLYLILLAGLAVQRIVEVRKSRQHERTALASGGREHAPGQFRLMQVLHVTWFIASAVEVLALRRKASKLGALFSGLVLLAGQLLRLSAIRQLGPRWTVRLITNPSLPPETGGIYQYIRHPNYLGVMLEIAAVPLLHGAWLTALFFSAANALLLAFRIKAEEAALEEAGRYDLAFQGRPRFLPAPAAFMSKRYTVSRSISQ
jgi:methyltransferase